MKPLPLGISSLAKLISGGCVYVDKTEMAWAMIRQPGAYFLSRPRRFGKSLFVDTLKEIFEGNRELFQGLYIHDRWDWEKKYPVIKIDFSGGVLQNPDQLNEKIHGILLKTEQRIGFTCELQDIPGRFGELIFEASKKFGQRTVVLVDEYDKPILDHIDSPDTAARMREGVKNLYSVLKEQDAHLQFVFMTGVSKFSRVSLFSGINQLEDITLDARYSTICGYTQEDLEREFAAHLQDVDRDKLRHWYNGYKWLGNEAVYNPYDILLFIRKGFLYRNYWFETGNPSFLIRLFAGLPWRNFNHMDLPASEGYYASVLYAFFASLDAHITPEDVTNHGQVDMTVELGRHIYVMEIKVVDETELDHNPALKQIQEKGYAQKYQGRPEVRVHELGLVFSRQTRNLICDCRKMHCRSGTADEA